MRSELRDDLGTTLYSILPNEEDGSFSSVRGRDRFFSRYLPCHGDEGGRLTSYFHPFRFLAGLSAVSRPSLGLIFPHCAGHYKIESKYPQGVMLTILVNAITKVLGEIYVLRRNLVFQFIPSSFAPPRKISAEQVAVQF